MKRFTRRQVVTGSAAAVLGAASTTSNVLAQTNPTDAAADADGWIELEAAFKEMTMDGHRVRLRAYNDQIPGPTLTITPGEKLRVRLKNSLTPYDSSGWNGDHNVPHELDHTNLHFHGMDVAPHLFVPVGTSDPLSPMILISIVCKSLHLPQWT
ncbi:MAG: multicopper oxidase domain-containing protein [Planctomycetota bacterium]